MIGVFDDNQIRSEYQDIMRDMQRVMEKTKRSASVLGKKHTVIISPMYGYPSETAAYLRKELGSDIEVLVSDSGKFSIRSIPPISHTIAKEFGGGGHPHAAGGFFKFNLLDKIFLKILKKNRFFSMIVSIAESQG